MGHNLKRTSETSKCHAIEIRAKDTLRPCTMAVDQLLSGMGPLVDIKLPIRVAQPLTVEVYTRDILEQVLLQCVFDLS